MKTVEYNKNNVNYKYSVQSKKWEFRWTNGFTYLCAGCRNRGLADKVAGFFAGAMKRTGGAGMDGLARANIKALGII